MMMIPSCEGSPPHFVAIGKIMMICHHIKHTNCVVLVGLPSLKLTFSPLKMDGWKLEDDPFRGKTASFQGQTYLLLREGRKDQEPNKNHGVFGGPWEVKKPSLMGHVDLLGATFPVFHRGWR